MTPAGQGQRPELPGGVAAGGRDERIDFLRGLAMMAVIVNHVAIPSFYHVFSKEGLGVVTGAEGFVLMSGVMVGLVYGRRMVRDGWMQAAKQLWARSARLYVVALATTFVVYLLQLVPFMDLSPLTTYRAKTGRVFSLYGENDSVGEFLLQMGTLAYGPGQINILGLYVALLAGAPFLLWGLGGRGVFIVVGMSWALYFLQRYHPVRILPSQSENAFSTLSWQLLFVHGVLAGYYRNRIAAIFRGRFGIACGSAVVALAGAFWLFALNDPDPDVVGRPRLAWVPESTFYSLYERFFLRVDLGLGRILNVLALAGALYLFLTRFWSPSRRVAGWLLIPIGRSTLYVFIVHLIFVAAAHNLEILQQNRLWINTLAHTVIILTIGFMVRRRILTRWIR